MLSGAGVYHVICTSTKNDYSSIAYTYSKIAEHEMLASYYKRILEQGKKEHIVIKKKE